MIHFPSLSLPSRFRMSSFCKAARSRSMVRWLTDSISDICLPVIVGDSLMRLRIFCWRSVSFFSDTSPSRSPTFGVLEESNIMVWNWVGVDGSSRKKGYEPLGDGIVMLRAEGLPLGSNIIT